MIKESFNFPFPLYILTHHQSPPFARPPDVPAKENQIAYLPYSSLLSKSHNCKFQIIQPLKMSMLQINERHIEIQMPKISHHKQDYSKPGWSARNETKSSEAPPVEIKPDTRLKSIVRKIIIGLIISLSALMFGYSLKEITSVPIAILVEQYGITMGKSGAQSILIGVLPIGAIIGVVITKGLITRYRRLTGIYIFTFVNIGAIVLVNITNFGTLIAGRFIEGICVGYYTTIAPIYLKEIAPKELRRMLGLFFSFGKIIGVLLVIIIEMILDASPNPLGFRIILSMTAVFSTLQAILIFFFGSDTPAEMIEKGNESEARKIIEKFYKQDYVQEVFNEYKKEFQMQINKGKQTLSEDLNPQKQKNVEKRKSTVKELQQEHMKTESPLANIKSEPHVANFLKFPASTLDAIKQVKIEPHKEDHPKLTFQQKKNYAYVLGVHLCVIRHWTGGNAIITQGGLFIKSLDESLGYNTPIIINSIQFAFIVFGLVVVQKYVGKRPLFLFSVTVLSLLNIALAVGMMFEQIFVCEFIMCLYMAAYGGSFISPIWSYPSQIVPASQALLPNVIHWLALALSTLIPPLVTGSMPHNNSYPVFLFFGLYGLMSFFHIFRHLRQSDGKSYNEIIKSFK